MAAGAAGLAFFGARPLLAAEGGGNGGSLDVILILVAIVGVAYLVAHMLLERIAERFGIVTGVEYIILGAVAFQVIAVPALPGGPDVTGQERVDLLVEQLRPILVLGTGSLGLMWGTHVHLRAFDKYDRAAFQPALVMSLTTFVCVAVLPAIFIWYFYSSQRLYDMAPILVAGGAVAMIASDDPIRSLVSFLGAEGDAPVIASRIADVCSGLAIVAFGLLFCIDNTGALVPEGPYDWLAWLGVHIVLGGTLGVIFGTFLRRDLSDEKVLTVVIGMVVFTSGIADGLSLSPIFVNFVLGVVLIQTCRHGDHIRKMIESIKHPIYIVLFIFAGAQLDFSVPLWAYAMAGPYLLLRLAGRWAGGVLARVNIEGKPHVPSLGRVLFAPGGLSIAMMLDFLTVYGARTMSASGPFFGTTHDVNAFYSGMVVAIIVSEILAYAMTRAWLIDAADVTTSPNGDESTETLDITGVS